MQTLTFKLLYVLVCVAHCRRRLVHLNVTTHPAVDAETHDAIGCCGTEDDALLGVAGVVAEHGRHAAGARNLLMYRDGSESGTIGGDALIDRALERARQPEACPAHWGAARLAPTRQVGELVGESRRAGTTTGVLWRER